MVVSKSPISLSLDQLRSEILGAKSFLVTTHRLPDGDGIGCQIALHLALLALSKKSLAVNTHTTPKKFSSLDPTGKILQWRPGGALPDVDVALIVDTNELSMLGALEASIRGKAKKIIFVDHHVPVKTGESSSSIQYFFDESAGASGELVFEILKSLNVPLEPSIARALYAAIHTDTGGFKYRRTSARTHRIVAELLESGVEPESLFRELYSRDAPEKLRLLGQVLSGLELLSGARVAVLTVTLDALKRSGATVEDTESFVNHLAMLEGVEFGVLFREEPSGQTKVSLRGYAGKPVVDYATQLGGGGHRFAAGATLKMPLAQVRERVLALLTAEVQTR